MTSNIFIIQTLEDFRKLIKSCIDGTNNVSKELMQNSVSSFLEQTGLTDEAVDILEDKLLCAICYNISLETSLTKCYHIFCKNCINSCQKWSGWHCPMCRTDLIKPVYTNQKRLYQIDDIIDAVMPKHNVQYISWKEQTLLERSWESVTCHLQLLHDDIVKFLEDFKFENDVENYTQDLGHFAQEFLLLSKLPGSRANSEHIKIRRKELSIPGMDKVVQILQCVESPESENACYSLIWLFSLGFLLVDP